MRLENFKEFVNSLRSSFSAPLCLSETWCDDSKHCNYVLEDYKQYIKIGNCSKPGSFVFIFKMVYLSKFVITFGKYNFESNLWSSSGGSVLFKKQLKHMLSRNRMQNITFVVAEDFNFDYEENKTVGDFINLMFNFAMVSTMVS